MKKALFIITMCIVSRLSAQNNPFSITGKIDGIPSGTVYLSIYSNTGETKDSAEMKNGNFVFKGKAEEGSIAFLTMKDHKQDRKKLYIEEAAITLSGNGYPMKNWTTGGSKLNADDEALTRYLQPINDKFDAHYKLYDYADSIKNTAMMDSLDEAEFALTAGKKKEVGDFIKKHPGSLISAIAIKDNFGYYSEASEVAPLYNALDETVKKSVTGRAVKKMLDIYETVAIGKTAPDIIQQDTSGNKISLSSLRGKYVMVDFWASWCGPCRKENPNIVKAFTAFKDKGFTIFGVSYDKTKEKWIKAIEKDGLHWTQVSDLQGWQNATSEQYYIKAIPANMLLDKEGKIIAKNLFGKKLQYTLAQLLN